jgi:prepilin-type processing-associated H-X9-DG protein
MQCSNNFKQTGIALHNYHDTMNSFPALRVPLANMTGTWDYSAPHLNGIVGTLVVLLPFTEQQARYDSIIQTTNTRPAWVASDSDEVKNAFRTSIASYACPSDGESKNQGLDNLAARTNIKMSQGDGFRHAEIPLEFASGSDCNATAQAAGQFVPDKRGLFMPRIWKSFATCNDGTSNTAAFSEAASCAERGSYDVKRGVAPIDMTSDPSANPNPCFTGARSVTDRNRLSSAATHVTRGGMFSDGRSANASFQTILPPNSPACVVMNDANAPQRWGVFPPNSYHQGGVNVGYTDGSVHFISDTIDCGVINSKSVPSGASPYGVWGALGTPSGGESKAAF